MQKGSMNLRHAQEQILRLNLKEVFMGKAKRKMRITLYFNDSTDGSRVTDGTNDWIVNTENLEPDDRPGHYPMYHIVGSPLSYKAL